MSDRNPPAIDDMERQKSRDPHAAIIQLDILEVIVDICEAEKAYGTIRRMALISKHHRAIVQPRLDRIRKRVVLRLDDYQWRDKGNDRNTEIIECSRMSPLPIDLNPSRNNDIEQQLSDFRARLRPKVILCKGRPLDSLARFINYFFPKTKLFLVSEYSRSQVIGDAGAFPSAEADAYRELEPYERFNAAVSAYCADAYQLETVVTFRYRLRRAYRQLAANQPGQRLHVLRAVTSRKDKIRSNIWLHEAGFQQESILEECMKMIPSDISFEPVELNTYVQLPTMDAGDYFWAKGVPETSPPIGYQNISEWVESFAKDRLKDEHSSITFGLFFVRHGANDIAVKDLEPIFETTCGIRQGERPLESIVLDRYLDRDFAMCVAKEGCERCQAAD